MRFSRISGPSEWRLWRRPRGTVASGFQARQLAKRLIPSLGAVAPNGGVLSCCHGARLKPNGRRTSTAREKEPEGLDSSIGIGSGGMTKHVDLAIHGVIGWAICGASIGIGRRWVSMDATLVIHAVVAPLVFGFLTWNHLRRHPHSRRGAIALTMLGIVVGLDALVVAPFFERSYAMFRSVLGTWIPFGSILASSYIVGRLMRPRNAA